MSIDEARGRIITFVVISIDPVKHAPMRSWYRPESATSITARLQQNGTWRSHEFRFEDGKLVWTYGNGTHAWRRVLPDEWPAWLDEKLATQNSKMDATDEAPNVSPCSGH